VGIVAGGGAEMGGGDDRYREKSGEATTRGSSSRCVIIEAAFLWPAWLSLGLEMQLFLGSTSN
jgi:hypothetical protein